VKVSSRYIIWRKDTASADVFICVYTSAYNRDVAAKLCNTILAPLPPSPDTISIASFLADFYTLSMLSLLEYIEYVGMLLPLINAYFSNADADN
jgi:hypothetical protein